ncbi:MAG: CHASE3 domain-containing protein, partial [Candidatus Melainabacteria bacterium]|nr:CHASE3 domain-containing protein [Candidatus Melainabacteria bacterium]
MEKSANTKNSGPSSSLTTKAALAVLATAMVLLYIGGVASQQLQPPSNSLSQSQDALFEMEETMTSYTDLRCNEIAYIAQGKEENLPVIRECAAKLNQHLDRLLQLMKDRSNQAEFRALKVNINDRIALDELIIETRKKSGFAATAPLFESAKFQKLTSLIESQLSDLRSREKQMQLATNETIGNNNLQTLGAIWIMMMAAFLIL